MKTLSSIIITILLLGCQGNDSNLGNSYYYLNSYEADDIGYPDGAVIYKSPREYVFNEIIISKEVVDVAHDEKYILVKRLSPVENSKITYFVIDKENDKVFGPITLDSLEKIRQNLKISAKL